MENPNITYSIKTTQYNVPFSEYCNYDKKFGYFSKNGSEYIITDKKTPRQWLNFLVNDNFGSAVGNDGSFYCFYKMADLAITRYYSTTDYLVRTLNTKRKIILTDKTNGSAIDLLSDCNNLSCKVSPGCVKYKGSINDFQFTILIFVPLNDNLEVCEITLSSFNKNNYSLSVYEDFCGVMNGEINSAQCIILKNGVIVSPVNANVFGKSHLAHSYFASKNSCADFSIYNEKYDNGNIACYVRKTLTKDVSPDNKKQKFVFLTGAADDKSEINNTVEKYYNYANIEKELREVKKYWKENTANNYCVLPDKNLEYFLNYWLKNQINTTLRYNRCDIMGYRDVMQDLWGNNLFQLQNGRQIFLFALSKMHSDGRCPRQYDKTSDKLDDRDFMDSPVWIGIFITDYIKTTGDYSVLDEIIGFSDSDEKCSVKEHIIRAFEFLHNNKGKNNLLLMRDGDWLDGLSGINKYGEATTVWGTIAVFYSQNLLIELFNKTNDYDVANAFAAYSAEYKIAVNRVGWDGNWYTYAFIDDKPIGSSKCNEGKIYLNTQTWAIFSKIYDSDDKLEKMYLSVHTYLSSMYGPHLLAPPYIKEGEKIGKLQKHRPGTFSNSAIYLHGAAFKVVADCACGKYDEALDAMNRILPNHPDNPDCRRTSEPYAVGNVYFGCSHPCFGMNLYTWFTATPSWLIHAGFDYLLGVRPDYDGLYVDIHSIDGWNEYKFTKKYRENIYNFNFRKNENKGVFIDGKKIIDNFIEYKKSEEVISVDVFF